MKIVSLVFLSIGLLFLLIFFAFIFLLKDKKVYLVNSFGYEIYSSMPLERRVLFYSMLGIFSSLSTAGIWMTLSVFNSIYLIMVSLLFVLGFVLISISNIIPFSLYKYHLISYYLGSGFIIASSLLMFFTNNIRGIIIDSDMIPLPLSIGFIFIFVIFLAFILNPKNSEWFKLYKVNTNGKTHYEKPKINYLALEEWLSLGVLGIVDVLFIILNLSL